MCCRVSSGMSVTTEIQNIRPGGEYLINRVWQLKETIREETGLLKQRRAFFFDSYKKTQSYVLLENHSPIGFLTIQEDGYILFFGIHPDHHREGHGETLLRKAKQTHPQLTCHVRTENTGAFEFYKQMGFEISHTISNYYEDGGDAYYLLNSVSA